MNKKWIKIVGLLTIAFLFFGFIVTDYFDLLPNQSGTQHRKDEESNTESAKEHSGSEKLENESYTEQGNSSEKSVAKGQDPSWEAEQNQTGQGDVIADETVRAEQKVSSESGMGENKLEADSQEESEMFIYEELTQEIKDRITGKSFDVNGKISYEDLRYVKVLYWGFDQKTHNGELIVNKAIAQDIVDIFKELYEQKYPIERMVLVDEYDADDNASMEANNTSAFNYRVVEGTDRLSKHSYGFAIDINPLYNPYVRNLDGKTVVTPTNGEKYADRSLECEYYINKDDVCYKAFVSRGFTWGGEWKTVKDYQHFQKDID